MMAGCIDAKVVAREPGLDVALLKIEESVDLLPHFNIDEAANGKMATAGDLGAGLQQLLSDRHPR